MSERMWFYVKESKRMGPIPESKMQEMFDAGDLGSKTLVWADILAEWTPASEVEPFRISTALTPPPLPKQEPSPVSSLGDISNVREKEVLQVRPWVRFWARLFDTWLFSLLLVFVLMTINPSLLNMNKIVFGMITLFILIFVESFLLSTWGWGTTPGKWLLEITLRDSKGRELTFLDALSRSFSVWWRGLGLGLPFVPLITTIVAYDHLIKKGITSWDREGGFVVSHKKIGPFRVTATILFFLMSCLLIVLSKELARYGM